MLAAVVAVAATPVEAAKQRKRAVEESVLMPSRGEARVVRRAPTRITVTRRSYLDAGTEVYPGSMNYTGYVFSPYYVSPSHFILGPGKPDGIPTPGTSELWNPAYHVPNWGY